MTGLPSIKVELDSATAPGTWPYDITGLVELRGAGYEIVRGRRDEFEDVDPGQVTAVLNNNDGRFSPGSAQYGIVDDQRVRITHTVGGTVFRRFTGSVQAWPVQFSDPLGKTSPMPITATDRLARLNRDTLPAGLAAEQLNDDPVAQWSLNETGGSTSAGDTSGNSRKPLTVAGTSGARPVFGTAVDDLDQTGVRFPPGGRYLATTESLTASCIEFVVSGLDATPSGSYLNGLVRLTDRDQAIWTVTVTATGGIQVFCLSQTNNAGYMLVHSQRVVTDGEPHLIAVGWVGTTLSIAIDGFVVSSGAQAPVNDAAGNPVTAPTSWSSIVVGGTSTLTPTILGVALFTDPPDYTHAQRAAQRYAALGLAPDGETLTARLNRLAAYAGIAAPLVETPVIAGLGGQSVAGVGVLAAMQAAVAAEGGALLADPDDQIRVQNRYHRANAALAAPEVTLGPGDYEPDAVIDFDKQYVVNEFTGTRTGGASVTVRDDASIQRRGRWQRSLELPVLTDDEVADRAAWEVAKHAVPQPRLSTVTIDLMTTASTALVKAAMGIEIGDHITVTGLPPQAPAAMGGVADLIVEAITERVSRDVWTLTLITTPTSLVQGWVLEDDEWGVLDSTTVLYF